MIHKIKNMIKKIYNPNYYCNDAYVSYLRKGGAKVGDYTYFYTPESHPVDENYLPFFEIGNNCRVTGGVHILAHDYSYAVLRPVYHQMLCKCGVTKIGNNVFIGNRSIILMGTTIGDNVIVGAGAVVSGVIPSNVVIAGNPAKIVCSLKDYHEKLQNRFVEYARLYYLRKSEFLGRELTEHEMHWYNQLWKCDESKKIYSMLRVDGDNHEEVVEDMLKVKPLFNSFEEFKKKFTYKS